MNQKIIVYSVNTGGYDELCDYKIIDPNVRYILFTDNKYFKSNFWEVQHVDFLKHLNDNRRIARYLKLNSHLILPYHTISIWIDNCFSPKINNFSKLLIDNDFENVMCYKHDVRDCSYEEAKKIIEYKLDYNFLVESQMNKYKNEKFPEKMGLFSTGFMIRKNNDKVKYFNEVWWKELNEGSSRDQLSQVYSAWKTNISITNLNQGINVYNNPYLNSKVKHNIKLVY